MRNPLHPHRFEGYRWWTIGFGLIGPPLSQDAWHTERMWWVKILPLSICYTREYGLEAFACGDFCIYSRVYGGFVMRHAP